jgi:penicillin-binding protein 2
MLSNPSVDPTELSTQPELWPSVFKNSYGPLRNKAIQDHFPAGSTFKTFTLLAALENGIMDPTTTVFCPGFYRFGNRTYHCHKKEGHGIVDALVSLKGSCDVYYYTIASRLGIDSISKVATDFGFGRRTGIQLRNEVPGLMPTEAWKQSQLGQVWTPGETLSAAIGQGYNLVTPLQLAVAHATLVNGGNLYRPYVVSQVRSAEGRVIQSFKPEVISNHKIEPKFLELIKEALFSVSNDPRGTAYATTHTPEELISGKTGTVQVRSMTKDELFRPCVNLPFDERHHAWFVGYAPRDNPEIVVSVLGMHECSGSRGAAPVARKVIDAWWEKKQRVEGIHGPRPAVR